MERRIQILRWVKWGGVILGWIMYWFTRSFGYVIGIPFGVAATVVFWVLIREEETRTIGKSIAQVMDRAIRSVSEVRHMIEIKRIKPGIIARVFLIGAGPDTEKIRGTVRKELEESGLKRYIWAFQLTDMENTAQLAENQKRLNDQLIEHIKSKS